MWTKQDSDSLGDVWICLRKWRQHNHDKLSERQDARLSFVLHELEKVILEIVDTQDATPLPHPEDE